MLIPTSNTKHRFEIDDAEYVRVGLYRWHFQRYVRAQVNGKIIRLHNYLFGYAPAGLEWDHIDRNPLNNKRDNLRLVTHSVNQRNKGVQKNTTSGVPGVCWSPALQRWLAYIKVNGRPKSLGLHRSKEAAIVARRAGEIKYWGADR